MFKAYAKDSQSAIRLTLRLAFDKAGNDVEKELIHSFLDDFSGVLNIYEMLGGGYLYPNRTAKIVWVGSYFCRARFACLFKATSFGI
ncbi:hypothetical protein [Marinomonas sp.]|uniref:hypothetical protein n=1 Tax=Marinomonas sp. TaxID=1904862 RepID=UPI003BACEE0E